MGYDFLDISDPDFVQKVIRRITRDIQSSLASRLNRFDDELDHLNRMIDRTHRDIVGIDQRLNILDEMIQNIDKKMQEEENVLILRTVNKEVAKMEIHDYLKNNQGSTFSDIFIDLKISPEIVIRCLNELREEDKIYGEEIE